VCISHKEGMCNQAGMNSAICGKNRLAVKTHALKYPEMQFTAARPLFHNMR